MFCLASKYLQFSTNVLKLDDLYFRIYLSANSGARIGIATELLSLFRVAWEIKDDPEKGFKYLYLSPDEYQDLTARGQEHIIETQLIQDDGESRYKITSIIGLAEDIGILFLNFSKIYQSFRVKHRELFFIILK